MPKVRFGVHFHPYPLGTPALSEVKDFAQAADQLGFDSLWVADHVLWPTPILDPLVVLTVCAACTKRIKLGTGVLILPLRQPAVLAKMIASLDHLSEGRVILGVGLGGENRKEFEACGVPLSERGRRADEGIAILRRLWAERASSYEGRYLQYQGVDMQPKPVQGGGPPIWVGGRSEAALRRAGRLGDGWIDYFVSLNAFGECLSRVALHIREAGRDTTTFDAVHFTIGSVTSKPDLARRATARLLSEFYGMDLEPIVNRLYAFGKPDDVISNINPFVESGATHVCFGLGYGEESPLSQLETLAREVLPAFR